MRRDFVLYIHVAVYQSIIMKRRVIRVGVLMYIAYDWLKIRQKQLKARQSRQNQVYLAFSSQKQVRCDAGQSQGSWRVISTCFTMYLFLAPKLPGIPDFGKNPDTNYVVTDRETEKNRTKYWRINPGRQIKC